MVQRVTTCQECGTSYTAHPQARHGQKFCSADCRRKFNNRRMTRGAELYDMFMSVRYQRSTHAGMLAVMSQMAMAWREDDAAARDGRQSWVTPDRNGDPRAFEIVDKAARERQLTRAE